MGFGNLNRTAGHRFSRRAQVTAHSQYYDSSGVSYFPAAVSPPTCCCTIRANMGRFDTRKMCASRRIKTFTHGCNGEAGTAVLFAQMRWGDRQSAASIDLIKLKEDFRWQIGVELRFRIWPATCSRAARKRVRKCYKRTDAFTLQPALFSAGEIKVRANVQKIYQNPDHIPYDHRS